MCWLDDDDGLQAVLSCGRPRDVVAARNRRQPTSGAFPDGPLGDSVMRTP